MTGDLSSWQLVSILVTHLPQRHDLRRTCSTQLSRDRGSLQNAVAGGECNKAAYELSRCWLQPTSHQPAGISGGERRRVSVGIGLVTDPKAIFLDEPTTGLDSENALKLMELLAKLSKKGRTVRVPHASYLLCV